MPEPRQDIIDRIDELLGKQPAGTAPTTSTAPTASATSPTSATPTIPALTIGLSPTAPTTKGVNWPVVERKAKGQIPRYKAFYRAVGKEPPELEKPQESYLTQLFRALDYPGSKVREHVFGIPEGQGLGTYTRKELGMENYSIFNPDIPLSLRLGKLGTYPLGVMSDIATDPLTYIPGKAIAAPFKALKYPVNIVGETKLGKALGKAFIPGFGQPKEYHRLKRAMTDSINAMNMELDTVIANMEKTLTPRELRVATVLSEKSPEVAAEVLARTKNIRPEMVQEAMGTYGQWSEKYTQALEGLGLLDPASKIDNYVPHIYEITKKPTIRGYGGKLDEAQKPFFLKERYYETVQDALKAGKKPELNLAKVMQFSGEGMNVVMAKHEFITSALQQFGQKVPVNQIEKVKRSLMTDPALKDSVLYQPKGALRFYPTQTVTAQFQKKLEKLADQLQSLAQRTEEVGTRTVRRETTRGVTPATGTLQAMERQIKDSLERWGRTPAEAEQMVERLKTQGAAGVTEIIEETERIRRVVGTSPALETISELPGAAGKGVGVTTRVPSYLVPKSIGDDLSKIDKIFTNRTALTDLLGYYDKMLSYWKTWVTVPNPGFHMRNMYSNTFNMWLGGFTDFTKFKDAARILNNGGDELIDLAKHGVYQPGGAFTKDIMGEGERTIIPRMGQAAMSYTENLSRIAFYFDQTSKGLSPKDAALKVKKYLFDYGDLTDVEREVMRRIVPFYTWVRKNVPLQIEHLITNTAKYSKTGKTFGVRYGEESPISPEERPEWLNSPFSAAIDLQYKGMPVLLSFDLPVTDLNIFKQNPLGVTPFYSLALDAISIAKGEPKRQSPAPELFKRVYEALPEDLQKLTDMREIKDLTTGEMVPGIDPRVRNFISSVAPFLYKVSNLVPAADPQYIGKLSSFLLGVGIQPVDTSKWKAMHAVRMKNQLKEGIQIEVREGRLGYRKAQYIARMLKLNIN